MNVISIFIAGAKKLKEQRVALKALTNDLNTQYQKKGWNVSLQMFSYENFGEKQCDYNDFITNQADLVLFVLKDTIGVKTEEEFFLATNAYKQKSSPEIITFLHSFEEKTPEIEYIERLVNRNTETYYVDYTNNDDLIAKAKERINFYVENWIRHKEQSRLGQAFKKGLMFTSVIVLLSLLFLCYILFDKDNHLVIMMPAPPISLIESGMGKDLIKQQILDDVKETEDNAQYKLKYILNELFISQTGEVPSEDRMKTDDIDNLSISENKKPWIRFFRKWVGKHDVYSSVKIVESDSTFLCRIVLDAWDGRHEVQTFEEKKNKYENNQKCALSIIKKSAAYICKAYSPIASILYDYHIISEDIEDYQMKNPWKDDLYSHSEREVILLENSHNHKEESAYSLLLLANYYEKGWWESQNALMAKKACGYYRRFLEQSQLYPEIVTSKISDIEQEGDVKNNKAVLMPVFLMQNGTILPEYNCKQLIIISNEDLFYHNGKSYYKALLYTFEKNANKWHEVFPVFTVNLGMNGIALANEKIEGDLKTPSGLFSIPFVFGYKKDIETKMEFIEVGKNHVWVCDTSSYNYNKLVVDEDGTYKSNSKNEKLHRPDPLNKYAIVIGYNMFPIEKGKGSAIFMHVERFTYHRTAGCISMPEKKIKDLIKWMNPEKNPYIYISKQME